MISETLKVEQEYQKDTLSETLKQVLDVLIRKTYLKEQDVVVTDFKLQQLLIDELIKTVDLQNQQINKLIKELENNGKIK